MAVRDEDCADAAVGHGISFVMFVVNVSVSVCVRAVRGRAVGWVLGRGHRHRHRELHLPRLRLRALGERGELVRPGAPPGRRPGQPSSDARQGAPVLTWDCRRGLCGVVPRPRPVGGRREV